MSNVGVCSDGEENPCPESGKASEAEGETFEGFNGIVAALSKPVGQVNVECVQDVRPPVGEHTAAVVGDPACAVSVDCRSDVSIAKALPDAA